MEGHISRIRRFNRTFTKRIGALDHSFLGRGFSLGHARLLFELGPGAIEVRLLRRRLSLDSGYVSRMLRTLERKELVETRADQSDGRVRVAELTELGRAELAELERLSDEGAQTLLDNLGPEHRDRLVAAMAEVERLLQASEIEVRIEDPRSDGARWCVDQFFGELGKRFEGGFDHALSLPAEGRELTPPAGYFLLASNSSGPVGCGALKLAPDQHAEVKRMWVAPHMRGLGVGRRLLEAIESEARRCGVRVLRLETNKSLSEAKGLYDTSGFELVAPFSAEHYADYWFEKHLI